MILFAKGSENRYFAIDIDQQPEASTVEKLNWLLAGEVLSESVLEGTFIGPRKEMLTPWSTNAVEITQNMGIAGIKRLEEFYLVDDSASYDSMISSKYQGLDQSIFTIEVEPEPIIYIENVAEYNNQEGLALNEEEIAYLEGLSKKLGRKLTDSEVFGFSQVNSEHCRHKIFNGVFIIDGEEKPSSLFKLIRKTSEQNPNQIVSAYKDNVAFVRGPRIEQFAPQTQDKPDYFETKEITSVLSLKAETHNFPTTVEPFNGAATGSGGEIRDRLAGGTAAVPLAGTAVYMTPYSRLKEGKDWEENIQARPWLYQTPIDLLIKASNGASDFGNKYGQPLINGSVLTFEHEEGGKQFGYDKVIMLAGGIGFAKQEHATKKTPEAGDKVVILGGDNYRIGMGGSAVSSVATGEFSNAIELNAVQRSNPEMQKRVANAIRAMAEAGENPIVSIHDHGAGGHLNCLSELVEETGGEIDLNELPVGDPTLSAKEIIGNESQERMGLVIKEKDISLLKNVADRERAPLYVVGETTGDNQFKFVDNKTGKNPIDLSLSDFFGNPPKTIMKDDTVVADYGELEYDNNLLSKYLEDVLQLEAVACKDWLTNKVDRSVTGKVAKQQTAGSIQLPLNNLGVMALDYRGEKGLATAIGHAPVPSLINEKAGSQLSIAESLTNLVWAPIEGGLKGVSLSANWMWPCKNPGEDARLYNAVEAVSDFACELGINIPTGKDSLSMTQKYKDGKVVYAPGTVIISAAGEVQNIRKVVSPVLKNRESKIIYVDFSLDSFKLGGSSFAQVLNKLGKEVPEIKDNQYFAQAFDTVQELISKELVLSGHDISAGGMITTLLEMCFADPKVGMDINLDDLDEPDLLKILFSEKPGVLLQVEAVGSVEEILNKNGISYKLIGSYTSDRELNIEFDGGKIYFNIDKYRDSWYRTSALLEKHQTSEDEAESRAVEYKNQLLDYKFPDHFDGSFAQLGLNPDRKNKTGIKAAIIREKGVNGDREMAYIMHLAGFDVKDVHMTDLISGREDLRDVNFIVFVGGFSNSDVLGSAKGWAGAFLYNEKAKDSLDNFYAREDTISLGVCNGCQLMVELGLVTPELSEKPKMLHNNSGKFESAYLNVNVLDNQSVMLHSLSGSRLGIWVAHGEGKYHLPGGEELYNIPMKYSYEAYPGNPNGSQYNAAAIVSNDGRHLAMMPHLERAFFPWQCADYPEERIKDDVTPWMEAFTNAFGWVKNKIDSNAVVKS